MIGRAGEKKDDKKRQIIKKAGQETHDIKG